MLSVLTWGHGYLDHAFIPHCTISRQLSAQQGAITHCWIPLQHQMHFHATLLILVLDIRFNFQIDVQCAEKSHFQNQFPYEMRS